MFKIILRVLAEMAFYAITMPIKILCLLVWAVWSVIDIVKDPEEGIEIVKYSLLVVKEILKLETHWVKTGRVY